MNGFRNRGRILAAAAGLLALALPFAGASAESAPLQLRQPPPAETGSGAGPAAVQPDAGPADDDVTPPAAENPPAEARPAPSPVLPSATAVEVQPLEEVDPNAVGVLDEAAGGLGIALWDGTGSETVRALLPLLPAQTPLRAARSLMKRLLLTVAAVPEGEGVGGDALLRLRVERLMAMGDVDGALSLLRAVPKPATTPALLRMEIDALLLEGKEAEACTAGRAAMQESEESYWSKLQVLCHLLEGRLGQANLGLAVMRELGQVDPVFTTLAEAAQGLPAPELDSLPQPTPLQVAMLRLSKRLVPADAAQTASPAVLRAIARDLNAAPEVRLQAAEKAERIGALPAEQLARIYMTVRPSDDERAAEPDELVRWGGARARALLYQLARTARGTDEAIAAVRRGMALGWREDRPLQAARIYAALVDDLPRDSGLSPFAGEAARILMMAGLNAQAKSWADIADRDGDPGLDAVRLFSDRDTPLLEPEDERKLAEWVGGQDSKAGRTLLTVADALGYRLPDEAWNAFLKRPTVEWARVPNPVVWHRLRQASEDLRLGETVALALLALGEIEPALIEPLTLHRVASSLRLVGLEAEARAVVAEAALSHGL